jgi:UDP-N-acetylmuramate dehydrogenase
LVPVREQVALSEYTTLGLGGPAARFTEAETDQEIMAAVRAADARHEPVLVLGGGSNLVVPDEGFPGTVIRVLTRGLSREQAPGGGQLLTVAAGEDWDALTARCVADGLCGLECLSGIPGLVGATPIQNVGAYGQEVAEVIVTVRVYDRTRGQELTMPNASCGFGYRTSMFKRATVAATGRFVVLGVTFGLAAGLRSAPLRYGELARALGVEPGGRMPLAQVREAVLTLRRGKGMVLDPADPDTRSAGSFFTNPVLDPAQFTALTDAVAAVCGPGTPIPRYPAEAGQVKVSAAWLIEQAGFRKGYPGPGGPDGLAGSSLPGPRISAKHTLALVNPGGASTKSLLELAAEISDGVRDTFGVELVREPMLVTAGP